MTEPRNTSTTHDRQDMPATDGYLAEWRERTASNGYDTPNRIARMVQARMDADAPLVAFARDVLRGMLDDPDITEADGLSDWWDALLTEYGWIEHPESGEWMFTDAMREAAGGGK